MSDLKEWMNPLLPAENRVLIADGEIATLRVQLAAAEVEVESLQKICRVKEYKTTSSLYHEDLVRSMDRDTLIQEHIRLLRDYFHRCNMYFKLDQSYEKLKATTNAKD